MHKSFNAIIKMASASKSDEKDLRAYLTTWNIDFKHHQYQGQLFHKKNVNKAVLSHRPNLVIPFIFVSQKTAITGSQ